MASDPTLTTLSTMKPTSGRGGIGRRAGFRFLFFGVWVQVPPPVLLQRSQLQQAPLMPAEQRSASLNGNLPSETLDDGDVRLTAALTHRLEAIAAVGALKFI